MKNLKKINFLFNQLVLQTIVYKFLDGFDGINEAQNQLENNYEKILDEIKELEEDFLQSKNCSNGRVKKYLQNYLMNSKDKDS